jgi:peptidoglycan/LPS O-acetylase OafA/YrhL
MAANWNVLFWVYAAVLVLLSVLMHRAVELPVRARLSARLAK